MARMTRIDVGDSDTDNLPDDVNSSEMQRASVAEAMTSNGARTSSVLLAGFSCVWQVRENWRDPA
jgi:hypothetical protein